MENQTSITLPEEACEIQSFIKRQRPDNTTKKTTYDINVIKRYFKSINERREIENIPAKELNIQLAKFFMNVRKKNGGVYEPTSLKDFQRGLQRYLNDKSSTINILQDQEFSKSREVLLARKRELVQQHAKGNRPQACRELINDCRRRPTLLDRFVRKTRARSSPEDGLVGFFPFISAFERVMNLED